MQFKICTLLWVAIFVVLPLINSEEKKWIWEDNSRKAQIAKARYEVIEDDEPYRPGYRPEHYEDGALGVPRPYPNQDLFVPINERPGGAYGNEAQYGGSYGHGGQNDVPPILTGPVPSWEKESPLKDFDKCKCSLKFNCPTPGISYGHCDVGKQYCCYTTHPNKVIGEPLPARPVYSVENGVLSGPGGPVDHNLRPPYNIRPGGQYGSVNGVLTGPGRPPYNGRPVYTIGNNGIAVGPGGQYSPQYRPPGVTGSGYSVYERSAKKVST